MRDHREYQIFLERHKLRLSPQIDAQLIPRYKSFGDISS